MKKWRADFNQYDLQWRIYEVDGPPVVNALFRQGEAGKEHAMLIAAAPELLEALKNARIALVMEGHHVGLSAYITEIDNVIAKATL